MKISEYQKCLTELKGKTIAVVYIFEGEDAPGFEHYWVWKSDIIANWINAIQDINCIPYIVDVRTFTQKAVDNTLPKIDFVLNLNCGSVELSSMSLVPSVCSFLSIPCIPCNSSAILMSENKIVSNQLAISKNIQTPEVVDSSYKNGIYRPLNLGSSIGVEIGKCGALGNQGTYQEFIPGYDVTIPIMYNPLIETTAALPPIIYIPKNLDPNWIYSLEEKSHEGGVEMIASPSMDSKMEESLLNFTHIFPIETYGRIDARIKTENDCLTKSFTKKRFSLKDFYFIEINSMPTIEDNDSWQTALKYATNEKDNCFAPCIKSYKKVFGKFNVNGFLLSSSMLALTN